MIGRWGLEGLARIQDSAAENKQVVIWLDYKTQHYNSVVVEAIYPQPFDSISYSTTSAMYALGSYNNHIRKNNTKAWEIFHSLQGNYMILGIHVLLMYFLARLLLLRNDPIPVSRWVNRKMIGITLWALGIMLLVIFIIAIFSKSYYKVDWDEYKTRPVKQIPPKIDTQLPEKKTHRK